MWLASDPDDLRRHRQLGHIVLCASLKTLIFASFGCVHRKASQHRRNSDTLWPLEALARDYSSRTRDTTMPWHSLGSCSQRRKIAMRWRATCTWPHRHQFLQSTARACRPLGQHIVYRISEAMPTTTTQTGWACMQSCVAFQWAPLHGRDEPGHPELGMKTSPPILTCSSCSDTKKQYASTGITGSWSYLSVLSSSPELRPNSTRRNVYSTRPVRRYSTPHIRAGRLLYQQRQPQHY